MSKNHKKQDKIRADVVAGSQAVDSSSAARDRVDRSLSREYEAQLHVLQVELLKLQRHFTGAPGPRHRVRVLPHCLGAGRLTR